MPVCRCRPGSRTVDETPPIGLQGGAVIGAVYVLLKGGETLEKPVPRAWDDILPIAPFRPPPRGAEHGHSVESRDAGIGSVSLFASITSSYPIPSSLPPHPSAAERCGIRLPAPSPVRSLRRPALPSFAPQPAPPAPHSHPRSSPPLPSPPLSPSSPLPLSLSLPLPPPPSSLLSSSLPPLFLPLHSLEAHLADWRFGRVCSSPGIRQ